MNCLDCFHFECCGNKKYMKGFCLNGIHKKYVRVIKPKTITAFWKNEYGDNFICSMCGESIFRDEMEHPIFTKYCPNCGRLMEGKK